MTAESEALQDAAQQHAEQAEEHDRKADVLRTMLPAFRSDPATSSAIDAAADAIINRFTLTPKETA